MQADTNAKNFPAGSCWLGLFILHSEENENFITYLDTNAVDMSVDIIKPNKINIYIIMYKSGILAISLKIIK